MNVLLMFEFVEKHEQWISQLFFIYQITPDSFTIDKKFRSVQSTSAWWCHLYSHRCERTKKRNYDKQNVSLKAPEWNGWHNSWLHRRFLCFTSLLSLSLSGDYWRQIHQCPGRLKRDRKIKLTVFIMWLRSIGGHLFKRSRFGANKKTAKGKLFHSSSSSLFLPWRKIILLIFRFLFAPIILRAIYINQ